MHKCFIQIYGIITYDIYNQLTSNLGRILKTTGLFNQSACKHWTVKIAYQWEVKLIIALVVVDLTAILDKVR